MHNLLQNNLVEGNKKNLLFLAWNHYFHDKKNVYIFFIYPASYTFTYKGLYTLSS